MSYIIVAIVAGTFGALMMAIIAGGSRNDERR
jgi:hypothetical protein